MIIYIYFNSAPNYFIENILLMSFILRTIRHILCYITSSGLNFIPDFSGEPSMKLNTCNSSMPNIICRNICYVNAIVSKVKDA